MKKYGSLIALAVVILLGVIVMVTRKKPVEKVEPPYSIKKVDKLDRIELTRPGEDGGLVVLAHEDDNWTLTQPVDAPLADRVSEQLSEALKEKINTDDIKLDASKLEDFGLGEDKATKVALLSEGAEAPSAEFFIGDTFTVEGTRAKRTYIKTTDGKVYRAQTQIGEILGKPVSELRSKQVQKLERDAISEIRVSYQDEAKNLHLKKDEDAWKLTQPAVNFELERSATSGLVNGIANLTATGFADGKTAAEVGLEPWHVKVTAKVDGDMKSILLSEVTDGKAYAKLDKSEHIYEIAEMTVNQLAVTPLSLRNRLVKDLAKEDVTRVDFGGEERISVQRTDGTWEFARGAKGDVKESALTSKVNALAQLRAVRFETPELAEAGLDRPAEKVTLTMKDGSKHTLLIGGEADPKGNLWAKWQDTDLVMVVPQWIKERSTPKASELTDEAS